jgi:hypothetical protein
VQVLLDEFPSITRRCKPLIIDDIPILRANTRGERTVKAVLLQLGRIGACFLNPTVEVITSTPNGAVAMTAQLREPLVAKDTFEKLHKNPQDHITAALGLQNLVIANKITAGPIYNLEQDDETIRAFSCRAQIVFPTPIRLGCTACLPKHRLGCTT